MSKEQKPLAPFGRAFEEWMTLGIKLQDEGLAAAKKQLETTRTWTQFALDNQREAWNLVEANCKSSRSLVLESMKGWQAVFEGMIPRS